MRRPAERKLSEPTTVCPLGELYLALTLDMSGVLPPTPGQLAVVSKLEEEVFGLIFGRERLPRLLFRPGVGGPGLV